MKKIISILLCAILCIPIFCACSSDKTDSLDSSDAGIETPSANISYDEVSYIIPGENTSYVVEISQPDDSSESSENGTDETSEASSDNSEDFSSNDNNQSSETSLPLEKQTGGLLVKMVKYDYDNTFEQEMQVSYTYVGNRGNVSIAILNITNETDKHYSITINGKYLDKDGKVLKTETQTWDQFKAGWQKYFLFRPGFAFDKFEYTIETKEYTGECWKCGYIVEFVELGVQRKAMHVQSSPGDPVYTEVIGLWANRGIVTDFPISFGHTFFVLLDESNQVIGIYQRGRNDLGEDPYPLTLECLAHVYYPDLNGNHKVEEWPERLKNVKCITIVSWVDKAKY